MDDQGASKSQAEQQQQEKQPAAALDFEELEGEVGPIEREAEKPTYEILISSWIPLIQESVRAAVTFFFIVLLAYVVYYASHGPNWKDQKDWLSTVLPAVTGLLGSALGFYFGKEKSK